MSDDQQITDAAQTPKSVVIDGTTVAYRDLRELIEAQKFAAANEAARKANRGIAFSKLSPPGTA